MAAATIIAGGLAALLLQRRSAVIAIAVLAAVIVGYSRIVLGAHSVSEVLLGAMIGLMGSWALLWFAGPTVRLKAHPLGYVVVLVVSLFHGLHIRAEAHIHNTALRIAQMVTQYR